MAKATAAKVAKTATVETPTDMEELQQVFKVTEGMNEAEIARADSMPGVRLEFDYVHFCKLTDGFVATLQGKNQKAYWKSFHEWESRVKESNIALHSIGVDPMTKILDRPRGRNNPLVRDGEKMQKLLPGWYVTWRVQGGEGDLENLKALGTDIARVLRRPKDKTEEKEKTPFEWSGEVWKIADGTSDPVSGEGIYNVMVAIRQQVWEDNLKAMSMASHNAYAQSKRQFIEGAENISRDMLGGKEKVITQDLDKLHAEEFVPHARKA